MNRSIHDMPELQSTRQVSLKRGPSRRTRRILRRLRRIWIGFFAAVTAAVAGLSLYGPESTRLDLGIITSLSLLMLLFLVREEHGFRTSRRHENYLWHRLRDLSQIFEVSLGVHSLDDVRHLAGLGLQETMLLLRTELGTIALHDPSGEDHVTVFGFEERNYDHRPWLVELQGLMRGEAFTGPIFVPDIEADPRFKGAEMMRKAGFGSFAATYIGNGDEQAGLIVLGNTEPCEFRQGDEKTFLLTSRQMLALLRHGQKLDSLREQIDDLKREVDELTYANQAKSEFASVASHELKTPLTAVKASVDTLLSNVRHGDYGALEEFLLVIREEADRLIEMTGKILEISSLDYSNRVMERCAVRLRRVVDSCAQAMEVHLQEKDMKLDVDVTLDLPQVFADPGMIRQILINLIGNAIKFSSSGQTVAISARNLGGSVELVVRDWGSGIPLEEQPHIFDRFYQGSRLGDNHIQSTGLGLAIVKEIIEQHQGQIRVESASGEGASFIFSLPVARDGVGVKGSPLDLQPSGEVEEFLRLSVDWIAHVVRVESVHLFLDSGGKLQHFHASDEDLGTELAVEVGAQAIALETSVLSHETSAGAESYIAMPLRFRGRPVGCFVAYHGNHAFRQEDLLLVEGIVDRIGRVLGEAASRRDPGRALRRAMRAVRDLLQSNQRRMPARLDPSLLAWELAERAGADRELARDVRLASNFHDVAMAQIGMGIEEQERPLSNEELVKLRAHPRHAARLLEDIQAMEEVSRIVMHHHEWFNGEGYPDGLAADAIPLGARIVSIIDAYCSMTAPRKYKPVLEPLTAARELVNCSGRQFDPQLITHFVDMLRDKAWIDAPDAVELLRDHAAGAAERLRGEQKASVEPVLADNSSEDVSA